MKKRLKRLSESLRRSWASWVAVVLLAIVVPTLVVASVRVIHRHVVIDGIREQGGIVRFEQGRLSRMIPSEARNWLDKRMGGPDWSEPFDRLTEVNLDEVNREITAEDLERLRGLTEVKSLRLYRSEITDDHLAVLPIRFPNLTELTLRGRITDEGLAPLSRLTSLEFLSLVGTDVEGSGFANLSGLPRFSKVTIRWNKLSDEGMVQLGRLPTLRWLKIEEEGITENGLAALSHSPKLDWLMLIGLPATVGDLSALGGFSKLSYLDFCNSDLSDDDLVALGKISTLTNLRIGGEHLTDEGLMHLAGLPGLRRLYLFRTKVTPAGIAEFQAKLPSARVESR